MSYDQAYQQSYSAPSSGNPSKDGLAIGSLVCGIVSLCLSWLPCCGGLLPIAAVVLGILGLKATKRTLAIIGIVLGGLVIVVNIVWSIFGAASGTFQDFAESFNDMMGSSF